MPRPELSTLRYPNLWQGCVGAWCPSQSGAIGYRLFDDSGKNNHGVLTNAGPNNWTPDEQKLSINYTGSAASSRMPATPVLNLTGPLTVCTWLKFSSGQGGRGIVAKSGDATQYHLSTGSADNRTLNFAIRSGATNYSVVTNRIYNDNSWHFVAGVYDKNNVIINIDGGREIVVGPSVTGDIDLTNPALFIGCFNNGGGSFVGLVDDTRIYNRALAPYEIRQLASSRGAAYERSRGRKKAYVPGYRITAPSRIQTGSARTIDGTDTESLSRGLVGAWCPSLGASGFRLIDRSGNNNHGTLTNMDPGTDWVPSGGKLALDFDGVNDYVLLPSSPSFDLPGNKTISGWVFIRSRTKNFALFSRNQTGSPNVGYSLGVSTSGNMYYTKQTVAALNDTSRLVALNAWNHLAFAKDVSGVDFYLNGESARVINSATENGGSSPPVYIGSTARDPGVTEADGFIDDVRLYNRALTPNEIRLLYTGGRGVGLLPEVKPKRTRIVAWDNQDKISVPARVLTNTDSLKRGLVGHWSPSVSGPQGNRLMDLSGQNNHGVLTNMDPGTDYIPNAEKGGRMALDFDGVNDYLQTNVNSQLADFTVCGWIIPSASNTSYSRLVDKSFALGFWIGREGTSGNWGGGILEVNAPYGHYLPITYGAWNFICMSRQGTTKRVFVGRPGQSLETISATVSGNLLDQSFMRIGSAIENSNFVIGAIDDVRLYNRALTPQEIRLLAQSRMPERATPQRTRTVFYSSGLISYLRRRSYNSILGSGVLS